MQKKRNYKKEVQELQNKIIELEQQRDTLIKTLGQLQVTNIKFVPVSYPMWQEPFKSYEPFWISEQTTTSDNIGVTCINE